MNKVEYELIKIFPNKNITLLARDYPKLYSLVFNEMNKSDHENMYDYLSSLGFNYKSAYTHDRDENTILIDLEKEFPQKIISNITQKSHLYSEIRILAINKGISVKEYLKRNGFSYQYNSIRIDRYISNELFNKYNFSKTEIGKLYDVTRERGRQIVDQSEQDIINKTTYVMSDEEKDILELMVIDRIFYFAYDTGDFRIINNSNNEVSLIIKQEEDVKYFEFTELPASVQKIIIDNKMNIYTEADFSILNDCKTVMLLKNKYLITSYRPNEIRKQAKYHNMTTEDYSKFIGYNGSFSKLKIDDNKIIDFFEENIIDGKVYISSSSENQWIRNFASRQAKMSIKDLIEFYGYFKAERDFEKDFENIKLKYSNKLKEYLIPGETNVIYLPSNSTEYRNIYALCLKRNIDFNNFIKDLGFTRITKQEIEPNIESINSDSFYRYRLSILQTKIDKSLEDDKIKKFSDFEIRKRNYNLVNELKELYQFRCQLCGSKINSHANIPLIEKEDGTNYVEVHHIVPLSKENYDEELNLDVLSNMIVVCPYHHMYLHYNFGGEYKITSIDNELYLINKKNKILVTNNYHLEQVGI